MSETSPKTPNRPKRSKLQRGLRRRAMITLAFLTLYVLSIGPLYWQWYASKFIGGSPLLAAIYEPLYRFCYAVPPAGEIVDAWVMLWIV